MTVPLRAQNSSSIKLVKGDKEQKINSAFPVPPWPLTPPKKLKNYSIQTCTGYQIASGSVSAARTVHCLLAQLTEHFLVVTVTAVHSLADTFTNSKRGEEETGCCYKIWCKRELQNTSNHNTVRGVHCTGVVVWAPCTGPRYSHQGPSLRYIHHCLPVNEHRAGRDEIVPLLFLSCKVWAWVGLFHLYFDKWQRCELFL